MQHKKRLSEKDKQYIRDNHGELTNGEIARQLNVHRATVDAFCSRNGLAGKGIIWGDAIKNNSFRAKIIRRFMSSAEYRSFCSQYFKHRKETSKGQPKKKLTAAERRMAESIVTNKKRYKDYQNDYYTLGKLQRIVKNYREELVETK